MVESTKCWRALLGARRLCSHQLRGSALDPITASNGLREGRTSSPGLFCIVYGCIVLAYYAAEAADPGRDGRLGVGVVFDPENMGPTSGHVGKVQLLLYSARERPRARTTVRAGLFADDANILGSGLAPQTGARAPPSTRGAMSAGGALADPVSPLTSEQRLVPAPASQAAAAPDQMTPSSGALPSCGSDETPNCLASSGAEPAGGQKDAGGPRGADRGDRLLESDHECRSS